MSEFGAFKLARLSARLAATGLLGAWLAGCSSDATRFSDAFSLSDGAPTPSANVGAAAAPTPNAHFAAAPHPSPVAVSTLPTPAPTTTGSIKPTTTQPITGFNGAWSTAGGSPIVVADGENLEIISRRYGVPPAALLQANGFSNAADVRPGTRLIIPVYNAAGAKSAAEPKSRVAAEPKSHVGEAEDMKPAKAKAEKSAKASKKDETDKADAESKKHDKAKSAEAKPEKADKAEKSAKADKAEKSDKPEKTAKAEQPKKQTEAKLDPAAKKPVDQTPTGSVHPEESVAAQPTSAQADAAGVSPEFRWPARGRIIEGFKAGGNDGINIAVPEGTSVKAAESGVVAYAGSELKGYGNLILIRHPNGFVSAYANNSELDVKRGDQVKRGQIIAKSGQSGNVASPQLHFELRKGSTPVDPTGYLAGL
jgi:murein DD-endopeptidase MepM/ murein hydrolase activator NlpD